MMKFWTANKETKKIKRVEVSDSYEGNLIHGCLGCPYYLGNSKWDKKCDNYYCPQENKEDLINWIAETSD